MASEYGTAPLSDERAPRTIERRTGRRTGLALASVALSCAAIAVFQTRGGATAAGRAPALTAGSESTSAPATKVVYGDMEADKVKALFEKFKSDESKAYETDDEESRRFTVFKENLVFIDKVGVEARASTRRARARAACVSMALSGAGTRAPLSS